MGVGTRMGAEGYMGDEDGGRAAAQRRWRALSGEPGIVFLARISGSWLSIQRERIEQVPYVGQWILRDAERILGDLVRRGAKSYMFLP